MNKIPGHSFFSIVKELFKEKPDPDDIPQNSISSKSGLDYSGKHTTPSNSRLKGSPSEIAHESNIDRYKHPSDVYRSS